ncbi:right-handed parallel beta-helix repeat-containing protein [Actinopolymorpha sp. B11F2]|uniref:right-handed parallel beta-helix repeat-containing protein n=1 Tax=Actinopolymorpha sp. B11F2 TaxID=3160862 RepID=UPI0032E4BDA5
MTNSRNIELRRMHISNTGYTAVYMLFANDHNRVSDSLLENLGGDGIKVEGPYPGEGDVAHHNTFTNNYIHHYGELVPGDAAGVEILSSGHNEVSHSVIEHSARYGVSLETRPEVTNEDNYTHHNRLEYLRIAHVGKDSNDMGALYAYGVRNHDPTLPTTNVMNQITIDDVNPTDPEMFDPAGHGVHMDFGGCSFHFANIEVTNVQGRTFKGSRNCNTLENNSWDPGFDKSKMEYDKIGVSADFPYPLPE